MKCQPGPLTRAAAAAAIALALQPALAQEASERAIRLGHGIAEGHALGQSVKTFAESLAKLSGSKMKVKVLPSTQLGSETQMIAAVRGGVQEMVIVSSAPIATLSKDFLLFDLPFLLQSEKEADALLDGLADKNLIGLCCWENGFRQVTHSKRAITKAIDAQELEQLNRNGMTVSELAPGEADKMRAKLQPVVEKFTAEIGAPLVAQAQQEILAVRNKK